LFDFGKRIGSLEITAQEVKDRFAYLIENKDHVKVLIMEYLNTHEKTKRKRKVTKEEICQGTYINIITRLVYAVKDCFSYSCGMNDFGRAEELQIESVKKTVDNMTDEAIQAKKDKQQAGLDKDFKVINNPETLHELYSKKNYHRVKLTDKEQISYDYLYSLDQIEKRQVRRVEKPTIKTDNYNIVEDVDTRDNSPLWIVQMIDRVDKFEFMTIRNQMKSLGGYYSRFKGGFIFKADPVGFFDGSTKEIKRERKQTNAEKLRDLADNMQSTIDERKAPRLANTHRRASMASNMEAQAEALERSQQTLLNIAEGLESESITFIGQINSKAQLQLLNSILYSCRYKRTIANNERYEEADPVGLDDVKYAEFPTDYIYIDSIERLAHEEMNTKGLKLICNRLLKYAKYEKASGRTKANFSYLIKDLETLSRKSKSYQSSNLEDMFKNKSRLNRMGIRSLSELRAYLREYLTFLPAKEINSKERELKKQIRSLIGCKIDGYFPTPSDIVGRMIDEADIEENSLILEPSAGKGDIVDTIIEAFPSASVDVVEINSRLRDILEAKGHNIIEHDFLDVEAVEKYDRIIMNPPFEDSQDIFQVLKAYKHLKIGGRIVAIMGEGAFFRTDKRSVAFREWLDERGWSEQLEDGSFKASDRPTGVNTRLVVIDKI